MVFGGLEKLTLIDYPGKVACMVYTIGCNFHCPYCHNPELVNETVEVKYSEEYILDFLDDRKTMIDGVVITGGEPTIHKDLVSFIKKIKNKGFLVKLDSNGTHPEILKELIKNKLVDYIAMDIKSPISAYSRIISRPVDTEKIKESVKLIMDSGIDYEFRTTVVKSLLSPSDLEQIGKEIKGAKKYFLQKFISTKLLNPQFQKKVTYSDEEFEEFKKIISKYVSYCGIR